MDRGNELFEGLNDSTRQRQSRERSQARDRLVRFAYFLLFIGFLGLSVGLSAAFGAQLAGDPGERLLLRFAAGTSGVYLGALLGFGREFVRVSLREFKADVFNQRTSDPGLAMARGMVLAGLLIGPIGDAIAFNDRPLQWGALIGGVAAGVVMTCLCSAVGLVTLGGPSREIEQRETR